MYNYSRIYKLLILFLFYIRHVFLQFHYIKWNNTSISTLLVCLTTYIHTNGFSKNVFSFWKNNLQLCVYVYRLKNKCLILSKRNLKQQVFFNIDQIPSTYTIWLFIQLYSKFCMIIMSSMSSSFKHILNSKVSNLNDIFFSFFGMFQSELIYFISVLLTVNYIYLVNPDLDNKFIILFLKRNSFYLIFKL